MGRRGVVDEQEVGAVQQGEDQHVLGKSVEPRPRRPAQRSQRTVWRRGSEDKAEHQGGSADQVGESEPGLESHLTPELGDELVAEEAA